MTRGQPWLDGNEENVMVMVCICANGSNVLPTVIFQGQYFLEKWKQNNPIEAVYVWSCVVSMLDTDAKTNRYCWSDKGWTDSEIGADWLWYFDEKTRTKLQPGEKYLLLLDDHISHFSKAFIEQVIELNIIVLCYPPHSTHLFKALMSSFFLMLRQNGQQVATSLNMRLAKVLQKKHSSRSLGRHTITRRPLRKLACIHSIVQW